MTKSPERQYTELGILEVGEASIYAHKKTPEIFDQLRVEAGRRGCDAVLLGGTDHKTQSDFSGKNARSLEGWWGVCLVYAKSQEAASERQADARAR